MQLPAVHPILEARDAAGGAAEAPTPRPAVVAVDLVKTYGSGEAAVTALGGDPVAASHADGVLFLADGRLAGELEKPTVSAVLDRLGGLEEGR